MKKALIWLLLIAMLVMTGCGGNPDSGVAPSGDNGGETTTTTTTGDETVDFSAYSSSVNVLCYNIFYKDVKDRSANIQDLILKNDPDVLMLQEVSLDWIPYIQSFMSENNYSYYGYGRYGGELSDPEQQTGDQYVPILWKTDKYELVESGHFWLSSTPTEVRSAAWVDGTVSKYPRCVNWVILKDKATSGEFLAMNIHTDPESDVVRTKSCQLAVQKLDELRGDRPVVIGGDWNMGLADSGYSIMTTRGYPDVRVKAVESDFGGSFNSWGKREEGNFAYGDHIFMSEDMAAEKFEVVVDYYDGVHISDHNPLRAVLYYN